MYSDDLVWLPISAASVGNKANTWIFSKKIVLSAIMIFRGGSMRQIRITLPQENIENFCRKWKISEMALFGSVLSEDFRPDSDIDILVSFKNDAGWGLFEFVDMVDELKAIFGRKVDLVEKDSLRNPFRRQAILAGNEVIYAA